MFVVFLQRLTREVTNQVQPGPSRLSWSHAHQCIIWPRFALQASQGFKPLTGFCLEGWGSPEGNLVNGGCWNHDPVPSHWSVAWHDVRTWAQEVERVMEAAQAKLTALPTIGQAGCVASSVEAMPMRDQFEGYTYASFLLGVEDADPEQPGPQLGIAGYYVTAKPGEQATGRFAKIHQRYYYAVGAPTQTVKCTSLDPSGGVWAPKWNCSVAGYKIDGHSSFRRPFTNGIVVVNPSNTSDTGVPLGDKFVDPENAAKGEFTEVTMGPHSGKIFLRKHDRQPGTVIGRAPGEYLD